MGKRNEKKTSLSIIKRIKSESHKVFPFYFASLSAIGLFAGVYIIVKFLLIHLMPFFEPYSTIIFVVAYLGLLIFSYTSIYEADFYRKSFLITSIIIWIALGIGYLLR